LILLGPDFTTIHTIFNSPAAATAVLFGDVVFVDDFDGDGHLDIAIGDYGQPFGDERVRLYLPVADFPMLRGLRSLAGQGARRMSALSSEATFGEVLKGTDSQRRNK
jgi:hypothetical protein